mmetsp:Transcript_81549/g.225865  ORF Transcript_81549/g.225865 Transcript_81549/m.225865 type:complete len:210 (+) Transcript_81549:932-1561(+)
MSSSRLWPCIRRWKRTLKVGEQLCRTMVLVFSSADMRPPGSRESSLAGASSGRSCSNDRCCSTNSVTSEPITMALAPLCSMGQTSHCNHTFPEAATKCRSIRGECWTSLDRTRRMALDSTRACEPRKPGTSSRFVPSGTCCVIVASASFHIRTQSWSLAASRLTMKTGTAARCMMFIISDLSRCNLRNSRQCSSSFCRTPNSKTMQMKK